MSKTKTILIIVLVISIILLGVFWYLARYSNNNEPVVVPDDIDNKIEEPVDLPENNEVKELEPEREYYIPQITDEDKLKSQLSKTASAFVERYGSYSNQSNYENLKDLTFFMSRSLEKQVLNLIQDGQSKPSSNSVYYGMTTKVLKTDLLIFQPDQDDIAFKLSTQRNEVVGSSTNSRIYYQDIRLEMIKESGVWKVNKVEWL